MESRTSVSGSQPSRTANHLCVLVHGLWGNTQHLNFINESLRKKYSEDELVILACKRNSTFYTYDGIEIGGERVAKEIEDHLEELGRDGYKITKLSIVGYSMGGLFARYAIGLLDYKGYFDHIQPVNFTTFASPHLGVRTPLIGYANQLYNVLGARSLSASGRQVFLIDSFRDTGRPILSVISDPDSIFIRALKRFNHRTLYANIINDRTAVYYTTGISSTNPYTDLEKLKLNYVPGYEPVILDPSRPCEPLSLEALPKWHQRWQQAGSSFLKRLPIYLALTVFIPIGVVLFSINATIQTFRSQRRITLHETDGEGHGFGVYRIPYMIREVQAGLEDAFEAAHSGPHEDYLPAGSQQAVTGAGQRRGSALSMKEREFSGRSSPQEKAGNGAMVAATTGSDTDSGADDQLSDFPTLALTTEQFDMIKSLDSVGFRKYGVHIHQSSHSHAAIIVRTPRAAFEEGKIVIQHWLEQEFRM